MATPCAGTGPAASRWRISFPNSAEQSLTWSWHTGTGRRPAAGARIAAARTRPRLTVSPAGEVQLDPGPDGGLAAGLAGLLIVIRDAQRDGTRQRLKVCGNDDCRWVFYDRSHSRRGAWCDMAACGNLIKNRNLRARRGSRTHSAG
jgi:predicted RNA-binding Zn ribbon-like protein